MSAFTTSQLEELEQILNEIGKQLQERANRDYCCEGSASVEAVSNVASVFENYEPKYALLIDDSYEGN